MTERLSPIWPYPCRRCDRTEGCPCLTDPGEVATAMARVARRHRESVRAAVAAVTAGRVAA